MGDWRAGRSNDARKVVPALDVDIVIELIGGYGIAQDSWCWKPSTAGKHVVTASKALLAVHGTEISNT